MHRKIMKSNFVIEGTSGDSDEDKRLWKSGQPPSSPNKLPNLRNPILRKEVAQQHLCMIGKTDDGDSYGFLKIECIDMGLTNIEVIPHYKHLQYVNVSKNNLTLKDLQCLTTMPYLILIHADNNLIESAGLKQMPYLQVIIMNQNQIKSCKDVYQPQLTCLELAYNQIEEAKFEKPMRNLLCLDLRFNELTSANGIDFPKLDSLYLCGNKITSTAGIENCANLRVLHLRNNPLEKVEGLNSNMTRLKYINLRACMIKRVEDIKKLEPLKNLRELILINTPFFGGDGTDMRGPNDDDPEKRLKVLSYLPNLARINKDLVAADERQEVKALIKKRIEEGSDLEEDSNQEDVADEAEIVYKY